MPPNAVEIETLVQAVLQRLRTLSAASGSDTALTRVPPASREEATAPVSASKTITLTARVISLDLLPGDLSEIDCLSVPATAVVTPAVHDELRWQNVRLERQLASSGTRSGRVESGLLVVSPAGRRADGIACEQTTSSGNAQADVCRLAAHVNSGGELALWWCPTPYAASRAAAGNSSLQAVLLADPADWQRALREADPNVLIVDATKWDAEAIRGLAVQLIERRSR